MPAVFVIFLPVIFLPYCIFYACGDAGAPGGACPMQAGTGCGFLLFFCPQSFCQFLFGTSLVHKLGSALWQTRQAPDQGLAEFLLGGQAVVVERLEKTGSKPLQTASPAK
jgi:hypothetical protein